MLQQEWAYLAKYNFQLFSTYCFKRICEATMPKIHFQDSIKWKKEKKWMLSREKTNIKSSFTEDIKHFFYNRSPLSLFQAYCEVGS